MCVIGVYARGMKFDYEEIHNCFQYNHDGAGVMWQENGFVHIKKGFMSESDFVKYIMTLPTDVDRVLHFRIATSGKISTGCCHPFPVCDDFKQMMKGEQIVPMAYVHNGVLPAYTPSSGMRSSFSDTMVFGKEVLSHLMNMGVDLFDPVVDTLIENTIGSDKMVIMNGDEMVLLGSFLVAPSGAKYSNVSYERNRFATASSSNYYGDCLSLWEKEDNITFDISFDINANDTTFKGWRNDDFTCWIEENLLKRGVTVYGVDLVVDGTTIHAEVGCWSDSKALRGKFRKVVSHSREIKDTWEEQLTGNKIPVNIKFANVLVESM